MARTEEGRRGGVENGLGGQEICLIVGNYKKDGDHCFALSPAEKSDDMSTALIDRCIHHGAKWFLLPCIR